DFAVLALQAYQRLVNRQIVVCEPLAGCGVRGIRFAREVDGVSHVIVNDINEKAFQLAKYNVAMNHLDEKVEVHNEDANFLLSSHAAPRRRFDAVDVDPFGSPAPFLDSAIRAVRDGGLLALTATDMAPLCGVHPKACLRKYGGKPLRTEYCHEIAVRLLIGLAVTMAARHEVAVSPVFSHSTDHYVRVYLRIKHGAKEADKSLKEMGYILHCFRCFHRETVRVDALLGHDGLCPECGGKMDYAGPLWLGSLWDCSFYELMTMEVNRKKLGRKRRIQKILTLISEEIRGTVGYYVVDRICEKAGLPVPSVKKVVDALKAEGFKASRTHFNPKGVRTGIPAKTFLQLVKEILQ
ncbi:tRNA (guanine(10)-N(2))-dimethyltransferase, partial [Candidatus Bathyarchaeota archaeon]|nr:tRNA (guanine(10)-N(2))-dimethyltransferase [Candidatus Bathyarchaeota archaeon]